MDLETQYSKDHSKKIQQNEENYPLTGIGYASNEVKQCNNDRKQTLIHAQKTKGEMDLKAYFREA
jgi:hypothetical protein